MQKKHIGFAEEPCLNRKNDVSDFRITLISFKKSFIDNKKHHCI